MDRREHDEDIIRVTRAPAAADVHLGCVSSISRIDVYTCICSTSVSNGQSWRGTEYPREWSQSFVSKTVNVTIATACSDMCSKRSRQMESAFMRYIAGTYGFPAFPVETPVDKQSEQR